MLVSGCCISVNAHFAVDGLKPGSCDECCMSTRVKTGRKQVRPAWCEATRLLIIKGQLMRRIQEKTQMAP